MLEKLLWKDEGFITQKDEKPVDVTPVGQPMWVVFDETELSIGPERVRETEEKIRRYGEMHGHEFDAYCRDSGTSTPTISDGKGCRIFHFSVQLYKILEKKDS